MNLTTLQPNFLELPGVELSDLAKAQMQEIFAKIEKLKGLVREEEGKILDQLIDERGKNIDRELVYRDNKKGGIPALTKEYPIVDASLKEISYETMSQTMKGKIEKDVLNNLIKVLNYKKNYNEEKDKEWTKLGNQNMGSWGIVQIRELLKGSHQRKRKINLSNNDLCSLSVECILVLAKGLRYVEDIYLQENNLGAMTREKMAAMTSGLKNIKSVNLIKNKFGEISQEAMVPLVNRLKQVKVVDLGLNNLGILGKKQRELLAEGLKENVLIKLRENNLGNLGEEERKALSEGMQNAKVIDLSFNNLGNLTKEKIKYLAAGLAGAKLIDLSLNDIGTRGEEELLLLVHALKNAKEIQLRGNGPQRSGFRPRQEEIIRKELVDKGVICDCVDKK